MADPEERTEISEQTRQLIDRLGDRLAAAPGYLAYDQPAARMVAPGPAFDREEEDRGDDDPLLIEDKLKDVEIEIRAAEASGDRERLVYLQDMRALLQKQLRVAGANRRIPVRAWRGRLRDDQEDYLAPITRALHAQEPGAYWLHGEDARERDNALQAIEEVVARSRRGGYPLVVEFGRRRRLTSRPRPYIEEQIQMAWHDRREWGHLSLDPNDVRVMSRDVRGGGVVLVLNNFPGRSRRSMEFVGWLRDQPILRDYGPLLLTVISKLPPLEGAGLEVIECVSSVARIGREMAATRLQRGWNRTQAAEHLRIDELLLAEIESGIADISRGRLGELARELSGDQRG